MTESAPVGTTHRLSRRKWPWPRSRARGRWPSWRSSSMSTPIKSRNGRVSFSKARPVFSDMAESRPCQRQLVEGPSCQDRRAGVGKRFFVRRAHQGGPAERKAMIDQNARSPDFPPSEGSEHQPGHGLLPAPSGLAQGRTCASCGGSTNCIWSARSRALAYLRDFLDREGIAVGRRHHRES